MTTATTPRTVRTQMAFGFIIGGAWVSEVILANLRGASVFGNLQDSHPLVYALAPWLALCAVALTAIAGYVAAFRTGSIAAALSVGVRSGVISGVTTCLIGVSITFFFHDAMMKDLSNVHEFARSAHRAPTEAELSHFLYTDSIAGGFNHIWIGPLLGLTVGAVGALIGKLAHGGLLRIGESGHSPLNAVLMRRRPETYPL